MTFTASETASYEAAAKMAATWGSPVSDGCIHQHVQRLGQAAAALSLPTPQLPPKEPEFSLVIMLDGWLARERGPDWAAGSRKKNPRRIVWHEIKSAVIYRLGQRAQNASGRGMLIEKFVVAMPAQTSPVDFGAAVQAEARRRGLGRAKTVYLVMDGAVWLWELAKDRFAEATKTLDFHHARDHLWGPRARIAWPRHSGSQGVGAIVIALAAEGTGSTRCAATRRASGNESERSRQSQEIVEREVNYFLNHRDHLHYQALEHAGAPRGSGAVESLGKQLQRRLRKCDKQYDADKL